jgi:hypothetical protein
MQALRRSRHSAVAAHSPSPGGSLPLPSQGIYSGSPGCCDTFGTPCPPKKPTVYCPGVWGLHSPKANCRCWWRPEGSSAATPALSWPFRQELSPAGRPIPDHWRRSCSDVSQLLVARSLDTLGHHYHPFLVKMKMCHLVMGHLPQTMT